MPFLPGFTRVNTKVYHTPVLYTKTSKTLHAAHCQQTLMQVRLIKILAVFVGINCSIVNLFLYMYIF